jgi:hypothetical protein
MKIRLHDGLPYITALCSYRDQQLSLENVLLDIGSGGTVFAIDKVLSIGLQYEADDVVHRIQGIGGAEFVFTKRVDRLGLGELQLDNFEIEIGAMDYGFPIDGIVDMDFLTQVGALIDLANLELSPFADQS